MDNEFLKYAEYVEDNRKSLIENAKSKGKIIDDDASLGTAVSVNNSIAAKIEEDYEMCKVSWFDIDGSLVKSGFYDFGADISNEGPVVNFDPDYLEFDHWFATDIKTHIHGDVDLGPCYKTKPDADDRRPTVLFIKLYDDEDLEFTIPELRLSYSGSPSVSSYNFSIDWGDGNTESFDLTSSAVSKTHTYLSSGEYIIKLYFTVPATNGALYSWISGTSTIATTFKNSLKRLYISEELGYFGTVSYESTVGYKRYIELSHYNNLKYLSAGSIYLKGIEQLYHLTCIVGSIFRYNTSWFLQNSLLKKIIWDSETLVETDIYNVYQPFKEVILPYGLENITFWTGYPFKKITLPDTLKEISGYSYATIFKYNKKKADIAFLETLIPNLKETAETEIDYNNFSGTFFSKKILINSNVEAIELYENYLMPGISSSAGYQLADEIEILNSNTTITINRSITGYSSNLETLKLPQDFNQDLNLTLSRYLTDDSLIDIAKKLKDNTGDAIKTIYFYNRFKYKLRDLTVDGVDLMTIIQNKNWTITFI